MIFKAKEGNSGTKKDQIYRKQIANNWKGK